MNNTQKDRENKIEHNAKLAAVAKADKAWTDYAALIPESRIVRRLAELWKEKEQAKVALKKFLK